MQEDEENENNYAKKKHMTEKLGVTEKGPAPGQKHCSGWMDGSFVV